MLNTELKTNSTKFVHVAVGVIYDTSGRVLIALRKQDQHQGGLWEFPGGKVESGETCQQALVRELNEELGIVALSFEPLIKISHAYPDKSVTLDVWSITGFTGTPLGKEGQAIKWVDINALSEYQFPIANAPIVKAILLPKFVAISGEFDSAEDCLFRCSRAIDRGAGIIQLRLPFGSLLDPQLLSDVKALCVRRAIKLVVNSSIAAIPYCTEVGLHLTSKDLMALSSRPVNNQVLLGASCHNDMEIKQAEIVGVDYIFLSPVKSTLSHDGALPLGWVDFAKIVEDAKIPVYALGGLDKKDVEEACGLGAQGAAMLGYFWR